MTSAALVWIGLLLTMNAEREGTPLPGCGTAAAHSFLRCQGREVSLQQVDRALRERRPDFDPFRVSVADVQQALATFGAEVQAVRVDSSESASLPRPSILFFRPGRWPRTASAKVGHFVTLVKIVDGDAVLLDWNGVSTESAVKVPLVQLSKVWDGEAIIPVEAWWATRQALAGVLVAICGIAVFAASWIGRGKSGAPPTARTGGVRMAVRLAALLAATGVVGCGGSPALTVDEETSPLAFEKPMSIRGPVPGGRALEECFEFRVWDQGPVTITALEASCGCTTPDRDLIGKELAPGSKQILRVRVRPDGEGLSVTRLIQIHTTPVSGGPLTIGIQYRRQDPPRISRNPIAVNTAPDAVAVAELDVVYRRPPAERTVSIVPNRCSGTHFAIASVDAKSEVVKFDASADVDIAVDTTHVELRGLTRLPYGEHRGQFTFAFDDGTEQVVEAVVSVPHPFRPQLSRLFCGFLSPGERWSRSIVCERSGEPSFEVAGVQTEGHGMQARLVAGNRLEISGEAPRVTGRFEQAVVVTFAPSTIPPLRVPVSGVVRNGGRQ